MLRKARRIIAAIVFLLVTLLFLDFTGTLHLWFGWLVKIQLVPAILAVNIVVLTVLALVTFLFGRVYCSVICPLGIMQDGISNISGRRRGKKNRFRYSKPKKWLRYGFLALFIIGLIAGVSVIVSLFDPYANFGRIASNLLAPLYRLGNNLLVWVAERVDSYMFYPTEVWIKSWAVFGVSAVVLTIIGILSWKNGRIYCNVVCPVGTFLGFISRFSIFRPAFIKDKCKKCGLCEKNCKSSCIDSKNLTIDQSRCVPCFNCIDKCKFGGIKYTSRKKVQTAKKEKEATTGKSDMTYDESRRNFLSLIGMMTIAGTVQAQKLHVDGGLAVIEDKKVPVRKTPVIPPGAQSLRNLNSHCTACQLCVSACPNNVLRPSEKLATFMQPEMSFERGFCRPECTECSNVCPNKAIIPISAAEKTAISIGQAVWIKENCVVTTNHLQCESCERHCPTGAIHLVAIDPSDAASLKVPVVFNELCIGCGACEHHCPARPFSAIYVEGNVRHHTV